MEKEHCIVLVKNDEQVILIFENESYMTFEYVHRYLSPSQKPTWNENSSKIPSPDLIGFCICICIQKLTKRTPSNQKEHHSDERSPSLGSSCKLLQSLEH